MKNRINLILTAGCAVTLLALPGVLSAAATAPATNPPAATAPAIP